MYCASPHRSIDPPWTDLEPIRIGAVPPGHGTPERYVTVERDGRPFARVDVYAEWDGHAQAVLAWEPFVVVGWGDAAWLVDPVTRGVRTIACDEYLDGLYPVDDRLLVASASELVCVDRRGGEVWRRRDLGIDGVVVDDVAEGVIFGQGEWDPPGGWSAFRVDLRTGKLLWMLGRGTG